MTCPNWTSLVARRDAGEEPAGWTEAVDHMDRCDDCRRTALAADPTLVFRRLPRVGTSASEADEMRRAVASLRRASRVTGNAEGRSAELPGSELRAGNDAPPLGRWGRRLRAAAAALLLTAIGAGVWFAGGEATTAGFTESEPRPVAAADGLRPGGPGRAPVTGSEDSTAPPTAEELATRPVFEGLSLPQAADVYQLGDDDLLVVMVVDETLDI